MRKIIGIIAVLAILAGAGYFFRAQLGTFWSRLENKILPCQQPIEYSLGSFDSRFGISKANFLSAVNEAAQIWGKAINKKLFEYSPTGDLKINLIYDYRQEATAKLQKLGIAVNDSRSSYDLLKSRYDAMLADYNQKKTAYDSQVAAYRSRLDDYNAQVNSWNQRGGAPGNIYNQLNQEKLALNSEAESIRQIELDLNSEVANINAAVVVLNQMANALNLNVEQYNAIGASQGSEFEEGNYQSGPGGRQIDVYQFDNKDKLVRVLAHELGHALGLQHVDDPKAIMYRLNNGVNEVPTAADVSELKSECGIK